MTATIQDYVYDAPATLRLDDIEGMLMEETPRNPIDSFEKRLREILAYGTENELEINNLLGRLLVLAAVSAAEAYFRSVFAGVMRICPIAQQHSSEKKINLGGLLWHGQVGLSLSAFDDLSFSNAENVKKGAQGYLGFTMADAKFKSALAGYDTVCNLRHGIVHNDGMLPGKNAVQLDIPRYNSQVRIIIRYKHLQDIAAVVATLVTLFNRELFAQMCERWARHWRQRSDWSTTSENSTFNALWRMFRATSYTETQKGRQLTRAQCKASVKAFHSVGGS